MCVPPGVSRLIACVTIALFAGCAGAAPGQPTPPAEAEAPTGLVWFVDAAGVHRTLWVSTRDARPLSSQPIEGPVWAAGSMLWQWTEEPVAVPLAACDAMHASVGGTLHAGESTAGTAMARRVVLRELTQSISVEMRAPPSLDAVRELSHTIEPLASVGPYLFAREELAYEPCGAPRTVEARALVWDLAAARPAEILREHERAAIAAREAADARARLRDQGVDDVGGIALAGLTPRWDAKRGLAVDYLFVAEPCYACGELRPVSARVTATLLPEELAASSRIPRWVRAAVARLDGATLAGFSRVDHPEPLRVLDALRR